ncbi:hypothetical protein Ccrd_023590, partial [Cynara cardunculus var. scolymus]
MIIEQLHAQRVVLVNQNLQGFMSTTSIILANAFDNEKLLSAMETLKHGEAVDIPKYNFRSYKNNVSRRKGLKFYHIQRAYKSAPLQ